MSRRLRACVLATLLVGLSGCALGAFVGGERIEGEPTAAIGRDGDMTVAEMESIFAGQVDAIEGPPGAIRTRVGDISVYLISDELRDRMRIVAPIAHTDGIDPRVFNVLLEANFDRTLDARYGISEGVVYAVFLHPVSSLTPALIQSGFEQVLSLWRTYGTTFSSGKLEFGVPAGRER